MEIHAPESPVNSLKDFLVHISIVTVGILIALGLEGLREAAHNRHLVRETRENVHTEMGYTLQHADEECKRVTAYGDTLKALVATLPSLSQHHPEHVLARLNTDSNPGYFLEANSYDVALSTGVFAHLGTPEISAYAYAAHAVKDYTALQTQGRTAEEGAKAYLMAHPNPSPAELGPEVERLMLFARSEENLAFVCPQMHEDVARAVRASAP